MKKVYLVQKIIIASSAEEALLLERTKVADEVFLDAEWKKQNPPYESESNNLGFGGSLLKRLSHKTNPMKKTVKVAKVSAKKAPAKKSGKK